MNKLDLKYQALQEKIDKLTAENKRLRLRPSLHSTEANIFEFMNIKSEMAKAMLKAKSVQHVFEISILYLTKITNIHSIAFFQRKNENQDFHIPEQKSCPKKFLTELSAQKKPLEYSSYFFPEKNKYYYSKSNTKQHETNPFHRYLAIYQTRVILPIIKDKSSQISLLLLSKKEFTHSQYFKIVIENIQAQLKSSFSRIINQEKLLNQAEHIEDSIKERVTDYQRMNKEFMNQIHQSKKQVMMLTEKLNLYQGIVEKQKDIILRINKEGSILFHNPALKKINFIAGADKNNIISYFGEGDFPGLAQIIHDFEEGIQQINCEIQVQMEQAVWFNFFFTPIKNKRGLIIEIQVSARNINLIKTLEEKLRTQKAIALKMLNNTNDIHFTITKKGDFIFLSDNWEKTLGYSQNGCLNKNISAFVPKKINTNIKNDIQSILLKYQENYSYRLKLKDSTGQKLPFKLTLSPISSSRDLVNFICGVLTPE
ncbi:MULTISPECIES: PAS domain S-box protein [unclassified Lentimicrobium]|uniref:PAS domain-containing protein n=1 Tax=unclassified Lentimicrobium TaxID=2677434 RepID=UPI0015580D49|nr:MULTISPECIES: PAS domain S-box protein [unclassified Lentimicrobium]NPD45927.1 PAS domain S-box protein [Lentimicrobium sp. S6]NPD85936.1 PAS domain S-box protein [Lentimicrobium sp. L6]